MSCSSCQVYIHRDWAGGPHLRSCVEQTSVAVGCRNGCKWASSVYWKWSSVGERKCWWWRGSSRHGSCQVENYYCTFYYLIKLKYYSLGSPDRNYGILMLPQLAFRFRIHKHSYNSNILKLWLYNFPGLDLKEPIQLRKLWMSLLSCLRNMAREAPAWKMSLALPTTTVFSSQTGRRHGCWKLQGSTGQQREWKVITKRIIRMGTHLPHSAIEWVWMVLYCLACSHEWNPQWNSWKVQFKSAGCGQ